VNALNVPILFHVDSTDGSSTNMAMTFFDATNAGYEPSPWIIPPGGPLTLVYRRSPTEFKYLVTSNGNFGVSAWPLEPAVSPNLAVNPASAAVLGHWVKFSFAFHSEMTQDGCNGTEVVTAN
jgi:hypothetical protein